MEITITKTQEKTVLSINGRVDSANYHVLETKIVETIERGETCLLIDCKNLNYISSAGLRTFLVGLKKVKSVNGTFELANLQSKIKEIFDMSGFSNLFLFGTTE